MSTDGNFLRRHLLDSALKTVLKAARDGSGVALELEATRLLREHPGCEMSLEDIETELVRLAADHDVRIVLGGDSDGTVVPFRRP